jgi:hypothetical protein
MIGELPEYTPALFKEYAEKQYENFQAQPN